MRRLAIGDTSSGSVREGESTLIDLEASRSSVLADKMRIQLRLEERKRAPL